MTTCIALLRGINVGRAKRIAMADLRGLVEGLGHANVRTLLNSGNVVFDVAKADEKGLAAVMEAAIRDAFGFPVPVVVVTARALDAIIREAPLLAAATDPARHLVAFTARSSALERARPLLGDDWQPEAIAFGGTAAYLWCPGGIVDSPVAKAFARQAGDEATTRNWATVLKLQALARGGGAAR